MHVHHTGRDPNSSGRPSRYEAQYMTLAPTHDPTVPASTMPPSEKRPWAWARYAAGGITNSLGTGRIELSMAISSPISQ
jgi:hypothetical protein